MLQLPRPLAEAILQTARQSWPLECCGLLSGTVGPAGVLQALDWHPCGNISPEPERAFEIDPRDQFALLRQVRAAGDGRQVIACVHSHPNGQLAPSARDCAGATDPDMLWLIVAGQQLALWQIAAGQVQPVTLELTIPPRINHD